jgi:hypothetical protein
MATFVMSICLPVDKKKDPNMSQYYVVQPLWLSVWYRKDKLSDNTVSGSSQI